VPGNNAMIDKQHTIHCHIHCSIQHWKESGSSFTINAAAVVMTRTQFGKHTFSICGPKIWNQIPPHIKNRLYSGFL